MSNLEPRRPFPPTSRRSKSPCNSSLSLSRSSDMTSSRSRSPRRSRSPVQDRYSRRRPASRDRRGSPSQRRSESPLSKRRRFSPRRSRSPAAPSSNRRSKSPYRRSQSPRTLTPRPGRRMSPPHSRGHLRTRSPPGERAHGRYISEGSDNAPTRHPASSGRIRYPSQPGPMGRYNSRLGREWGGENTGQKREWTCNKCSEIFFKQNLYVEHVKERNLMMKCPGRQELLVLDDSPPAPVKKERRPANKRSAPPSEVILDDTPPHIAFDLCVEATTLPPITADADSELPPIVPPPDQSPLCLEPVSDQSLPTSPVSTSAPTSLPGPNFLPSAATGSSPPRLPREMMQSRVKFREDGVLMFDEVTVQAKKIITFKKNLFKVLPDLLDIPDNAYVNNNFKNTEPEVQHIPAKVNAEEPTRMSPPCGSLVLAKSLNSANSLLQSLPNHLQLHPISDLEDSEPCRKLPKCLREDDEIEEPALVSKVKASKPADDEMEFLLDKRFRKQFIQKKAISKEDSPEITKKSTEGSNQYARPCEDGQKDLFMEHSDVVASSLAKKKKKGMKRRLKGKMKKAANVLTIPSSSSPLAESKPSKSELTSRDVAAPRPVIPSSPVLEQTISSPVSSCSLSESSLLHTSVPPVPSSSRLSPANVSKSVTVLPAFTVAIISTPVTTSLSASISPSNNSPSSKHSTITTSLLSTSSSSLVSTTPMPTESMPTSSLASEVSPQPSTSVRSDNLATVSSGGVFTVAWQLSSPPRVSPPVSTVPSPPTPPIHGGEVMSLYQALGGSSSEDEEETPQPVIIRAGVDCMNKCPDCKAKLETGARAVNFSLNMADLSVLVDCVQCGVRVRLKGVLGARQRAVLGCGM